MNNEREGVFTMRSARMSLTPMLAMMSSSISFGRDARSGFVDGQNTANSSETGNDIG